MTTEREHVRRQLTASQERTAIFWVIVIYGTIITIELGVLILILVFGT